MTDDIKEIINTPMISEDDIFAHLVPLDEYWKAKRNREKNAAGGESVAPDGDDDIITINGIAYKKV